jgi:hypothetical protein
LNQGREVWRTWRESQMGPAAAAAAAAAVVVVAAAADYEAPDG